MFLLVLAGFVAGCGQKGPLYREAPSDNNTTAEQASDNEQGREDDTSDR
jgi:predicted small lipoprotein YifL